jgi:hypothetical protein
MGKMKSDEIVTTYSGRGEITFPQGGRIQCHFALTEYATGQRRLVCTGLFTQASYRGWEQLVHQYRVDPKLARAKARQRGLLERYEGRTEDDRHLIITEMVLIAAEAHGVGIGTGNLRLQMQFDCEDVRLLP